MIKNQMLYYMYTAVEITLAKKPYGAFPEHVAGERTLTVCRAI